MSETFDIKIGEEILKLPILMIKGKQYLQVAHRILWMRKEHKDWGIKTHQVSSGADFSVFKAQITDEKGNIIAEAHKFENKTGFADYMEKAETGAIGRALAFCGYGTQFAQELDEEERLADSPTAMRMSAGEAQAAMANKARTLPPKKPTPKYSQIPEAKKEELKKLQRIKKIPTHFLMNLLADKFGKTNWDLNEEEADYLLAEMRKM